MRVPLKIKSILFVVGVFAIIMLANMCSASIYIYPLGPEPIKPESWQPVPLGFPYPVLTPILLKPIPPNITNCTVIHFPGYYYLANDINTTEDACIRVLSSDVILDGRGHRIVTSENKDAIVIEGWPDNPIENVTITNLTIVGGGILIKNAKNVNITHCKFLDNYESNFSDGVITLLENTSNVGITYCNFTNSFSVISVIVSNCTNDTTIATIKYNNFTNCSCILTDWGGFGFLSYPSGHCYFILNNFIGYDWWFYYWGTFNLHLNSTKPLKYVYNGRVYINYLGNYYSNYAGPDLDGDGVGDKPLYWVRENHELYLKSPPYLYILPYDNVYPLMQSFENYKVIGVAEIEPVKSNNYKPHAPIKIDGNDDFTPENGVVGGSGTPDDPYIIEGWDINASVGNGIEIRNTTAYFVIRSCLIHDGRGEFYNYGILLYNVTNGRIENCIIYNCSCGIHLGHSSNNTLSGNTVSNNGAGIRLEYSDDNMIVNNTVSDNQGGIPLFDSNNNIIVNNTVSDNIYSIVLVNSNNNTLLSNNVSNNTFEIHLTNSDNNMIVNNIMSNNGGGIYLDYSNNNKIYLNNFVNNTYNVYSEGSTNIWNSTEQITYIYNGKTYTSYLGNYWSDYKGSDSNGDGIGDIPYEIDSDNKDYHPLMQPFENYKIIGVAEINKTATLKHKIKNYIFKLKSFYEDEITEYRDLVVDVLKASRADEDILKAVNKYNSGEFTKDVAVNLITKSVLEGLTYLLNATGHGSLAKVVSYGKFAYSVGRNLAEIAHLTTDDEKLKAIANIYVLLVINETNLSLCFPFNDCIKGWKFTNDKFEIIYDENKLDQKIEEIIKNNPDKVECLEILVDILSKNLDDDLHEYPLSYGPPLSWFNKIVKDIDEGMSITKVLETAYAVSSTLTSSKFPGWSIIDTIISSLMSSKEKEAKVIATKSVLLLAQISLDNRLTYLDLWMGDEAITLITTLPREQANHLINGIEETMDYVERMNEFNISKFYNFRTGMLNWTSPLVNAKGVIGATYDSEFLNYGFYVAEIEDLSKLMRGVGLLKEHEVKLTCYYGIHKTLQFNPDVKPQLTYVDTKIKYANLSGITIPIPVGVDLLIRVYNPCPIPVNVTAVHYPSIIPSELRVVLHLIDSSTVQVPPHGNAEIEIPVLDLWDIIDSIISIILPTPGANPLIELINFLKMIGYKVDLYVNNAIVDSYYLGQFIKTQEESSLWLQKYDTNGNNRIDDIELIAAIQEWLNGKITDLDLIEIIQMWLGK